LMMSLSHWGMFPSDLRYVVQSSLDGRHWRSMAIGPMTESFDGEFIPDPDRECGLSAQGAASERQLRWASHPIGRV
jgi:hypothetical protein